MTKDGYMVASNRYLLCKIKCDSIPECLKDRIVITLQDRQAGINRGKFPDYYKTIVDVVGHKLPGLCLALGAVLVTYHYGWWIVPAMAGAAIVHKAAKNLGWW